MKKTKPNAADAINYLSTQTDRVRLLKKDNTDKSWSYKLTAGSLAEFAFNPKLKTRLTVRTDREPPLIEGILRVERISGNIGTNWGRVFSGREGHSAKYVVEFGSITALDEYISYCETAM